MNASSSGSLRFLRHRKEPWQPGGKFQVAFYLDGGQWGASVDVARDRTRRSADHQVRLVYRPAARPHLALLVAGPEKGLAIHFELDTGLEASRNFGIQHRP